MVPPRRASHRGGVLRGWGGAGAVVDPGLRHRAERADESARAVHVLLGQGDGAVGRDPGLDQDDPAAGDDLLLVRVIPVDPAPATEREARAEPQHHDGAAVGRRGPHLAEPAATPARASSTEATVAEGVAWSLSEDDGGRLDRSAVDGAGADGRDLTVHARRDVVELVNALATGGRPGQTVVNTHSVHQPAIAWAVDLLPSGLGVSPLVARLVGRRAHPLGERLRAVGSGLGCDGPLANRVLTRAGETDRRQNGNDEQTENATVHGFLLTRRVHP